MVYAEEIHESVFVGRLCEKGNFYMRRAEMVWVKVVGCNILSLNLLLYCIELVWN